MMRCIAFKLHVHRAVHWPNPANCNLATTGVATNLPDKEFFSCAAGEFVVNHKILKKRKNNPKQISAVLD